MVTKKISGERKNLIPICSSAEAEHSPAAEVIFSNVDLLTEILLRLPAKSLIRFKCVSNHWLSLISNSQFTRKHTRRNPTSSISGLYFYINPWYVKYQVKSVSLHNDSTLPTLSFLDGVGAASTTKVLHSCNGLLLCSKIGFDVCCNPYHSCYIVCNLAIQKHRLLTLPEPCRSLFHGNVGALLAFDPSKSPLYKAVFVSYSNNFIGHCYQIDIYSSEDASWKHMRVAAPGGIPFTKSVFCYGAIHWMSRENVRIRFDVDAEKLTGTTFPPNPKISFEDNDILYFGECGGHLLLMQSLRGRGPMAFRIVEMDTDSCHWVGKYRGI